LEESSVFLASSFLGAASAAGVSIFFSFIGVDGAGVPFST